MQETVLITGGAGLVGSHLTNFLRSKNYAVRHISRSCTKEKSDCFVWDLNSGYWDKNAIANVDFIIHLAGANVAEGRWTAQRKQQILESRIEGSKIVAEMVEASEGKIKGVVSASAVGYYGTIKSGTLALETDKPGTDFLAKVCVQWENEIAKSKTTVAILRTGVVLAKDGGAVPKMSMPIKLGLGSPLGSGTQPMPWIHIDDLCNMYLFALENGLSGVYNAVATEIVSNQELTQELGKSVNKKIWMPNVPAFMLKLMLGEMSSMLLTGVNASPKKIEGVGFEFNYSSLSKALSQLLK